MSHIIGPSPWQTPSFSLGPLLIAAALVSIISGCDDGDDHAPADPAMGFVRVADAGLDRSTGVPATVAERMGGAIAAADYDGDGDIDLYVVGGDDVPNHLYQNQGDGRFREIGTEVGLAIVHRGSGPAFGDVDSDGDLDLFIGTMDGDRHYLMENRNGVFVDVTAGSGIALEAANTVSATFYDYDGDGFLDLFLAHWGAEREPGADTETVWRNRGDGTFTSTSIATGVAAILAAGGTDWSLTPALADIDGDGDGDLLMASDAGASRVLRNNGNGTFTDVTERSSIAAEAAHGTAVGDFDGDGDLDWFVTSVSDAAGGMGGNRLYRNVGAAAFEDATGGSNVADGGWGWGACTADFDNDGHLDLAHASGWTAAQGGDYRNETTRFFHNASALSGAGAPIVFGERGVELGLGGFRQGRGVACFDADGDGDIDMAVVGNGADHIALFRNDLRNDNRHLGVRLAGAGLNHFGIGAQVIVVAAGRRQAQQVGGTSGFAAHGPFEARFGLGTSAVADVAVRWPDGTVTERTGVSADQVIVMTQPRVANLRLSVVRGDGDGVYAAGDEVEIEAAPAEENYHFSHWTSSRGSVFADPRAASTRFRMPAYPVSLTAHYTPGVAMADPVSVARRWSEVLLQAIRNDFARPTVHARNLFHVSAAMYDAWAAYSDTATPWLLGGDGCSVDAASLQLEPQAALLARQEAMSFAAYRIIRHRFRSSPGAARIARDAVVLMDALGYDVANRATDVADRTAAALGNHIAQCYIAFGLGDGANEAGDYANTAYLPVNAPLEPDLPGNPDIADLDRWQPLLLDQFIDQAGNPIDTAPEFLSPEWGHVTAFALDDADLTVRPRDGFEYRVYHDPGPPPSIRGAQADIYKWAHALVAVWSSHLSPADGMMMDISPASIGNIEAYPARFDDYPGFFATLAGGDPSRGRATNPVTSRPYEPQMVPRGDYTRVLAEFWADGPDSETPPGHWFVILNEVADHPLLDRRFGGIGTELQPLEWDAKAYFALGGAMHDAAIAAWSIKGYYDYIRPISSLRAMADRGQSTDPALPAYHVDGIPLIDGYIELVTADDPLAGEAGEHVDKVKLLAWRGPDHIDDPAVDVAGVGWILAETWWPYQRPSFVTPPFAGYVSGHSTYSRAAAEVLARLTGSPYFPGGMSDFEITAGEFLVFEDGPSVDLTLQWATYRDAADQCSLSRIWGGIHPPVDDIPGRLIGIDVGRDAFDLAEAHFLGNPAIDR